MKTLEDLKKEVEALWNALQEAREDERDFRREAYCRGYEAYQRQKLWVQEISRS